ncbi:MAG: hypothetical protein WA746_13965 [Isosphaeraceae bacterium]
MCVTSRVTGVNGRPHRPAAALTIATMPALVASGSVGQAATMTVRAGRLPIRPWRAWH